MEELIKEAREITESDETGAKRDSVIVPAGLIVKYYHIAPYKRLCLFAEMIGLKESITPPKAKLNEEMWLMGI